MDNHNYHLSHNSIECLLAAGTQVSLETKTGTALDALSSFYKSNNDWLFGHISYDLKNEIENLHSDNFDGVKFPDVYFFVPEYILQLTESALIISCPGDNASDIFNQILSTSAENASVDPVPINIQLRFAKNSYLQTVEKLRQHILRGDCYEINLCQEFYAENAIIDPLCLYTVLSEQSPNPFSAYYKLHDRYLACLSPERYLKKEGRNILTQPIKGTSRRNTDDDALDAVNAETLRSSEKERAENIMVVDLVRNDLSKICEEGTVHVDELCGIYTFPQVHQMISTVSGTIRNDVEWTDAIKATFPMGSMTGAPKKKVMELIERYEMTKRGLFSGTIGYIKPDGDFDFNVVIRSVFYNAAEKYLSFHTGSAITFSSDAETEYEECLLKAAAIKKALAETNTFH